jgi:hypothetical protein
VVDAESFRPLTRNEHPWLLLHISGTRDQNLGNYFSGKRLVVLQQVWLYSDGNHEAVPANSSTTPARSAFNFSFFRLFGANYGKHTLCRCVFLLYPEVWGPAVADVFSRVRYEPQHELRNAIEATGNKVEDIKKM